MSYCIIKVGGCLVICTYFSEWFKYFFLPEVMEFSVLILYCTYLTILNNLVGTWILIHAETLKIHKDKTLYIGASVYRCEFDDLSDFF